MIKLSRIMLPMVTITLMAACTSSPGVQSDYDGDLDFGQYQTFDFSSGTEIVGADLAGNLELYYSAAVMRELRAEGLVRSDDPDILINVSVDVEDVKGSVAVDLMDVARNREIMEGAFQVQVDAYDGGDALLQSVVNNVAIMFGNSPVPSWAERARVGKGASRHHNN